jgi:hypothetical protein
MSAAAVITVFSGLALLLVERSALFVHDRRDVGHAMGGTSRDGGCSERRRSEAAGVDGLLRRLGWNDRLSTQKTGYLQADREATTGIEPVWTALQRAGIRLDAQSPRHFVEQPASPARSEHRSRSSLHACRWRVWPFPADRLVGEGPRAPHPPKALSRVRAWD